MECDKEEAVAGQVQPVEHGGGFDTRPVLLDDLEDRVTGDTDALARNSLAQQICAGAFGVWHQEVRRNGRSAGG